MAGAERVCHPQSPGEEEWVVLAHGRGQSEPVRGSQGRNGRGGRVRLTRLRKGQLSSFSGLGVNVGAAEFVDAWPWGSQDRGLESHR